MIGLCRTLLLAVLVSTAFFANSQAARAGNEIPISLQPGMPPDGAWPVVERHMRGTDVGGSDDLTYTLDEYVERGWGKDRKEALAWMRDHDIHWGYVDLDNDGTNEMVVWLGVIGWCGSAGCPALLLRREADGWSIFDGLDLEEPTHNLCYDRTGSYGYPMLRTHRYAVWWNGSEFDDVCYLACYGWGNPVYEQPHVLAAMTPDELRVRGELRMRPWCEPEPTN